ncbi:hypothetical protein [Candidatus Endomicrobiellum devescovinae]|jgi:hypothetical protein|uniref:hypothetical protein n=1 Tax=Candidatus Endomicrobiellum devescovinae TaxID=3242322 RepID=UPI0028270989|nr:hypothetical protein [Endomicrobium sp.]
MSGPLETKKVKYGIDSLEHGISLSFFKDRDDDIFYGNTLTFLKGDCDLNSKENFDVDGKEDSDSLTFEDTTSVGILFALNQKKTIKVGPTAGFCMSLKRYKLDKDFTQSIGMLYLPIGIFGEIELGDDWTFSPQFLFNLCLFGNISLETSRFKSVFFEPNIEIPANKAKAISIKANFSKKISKRVSFHIEPFFLTGILEKLAKSKILIILITSISSLIMMKRQTIMVISIGKMFLLTILVSTDKLILM